VATLTAVTDTGISEHDIKILYAVTRNKDENYDAYVKRLITAGSGAIRLKLLDISDNMTQSRLERLRLINPDLMGRLFRKYTATRDKLHDALRNAE
jgi:hypothetical protein